MSHDRALGPNADVASVADRMLSPVAIIDGNSTLLYINSAGARAIGREARRLVGRHMLELIHRDDRARVREELRRVVADCGEGGTTTYRLRAGSSGAWRTFESTVDNLIDDERIGGILVASRDISDQVARERMLHEAAYRDALTGLPNRNEVNERLGDLVRTEGPLALAFVDVDRFALVRHSLGHSIADTVARVVAERVRTAVPATMLVGQYSGDMLALLLTGQAANDAREVLWRVLHRVSEPLFVGGHELRLSVSAGVASRCAASTSDSLLRDAGLALHRAKTQGGGRLQLFEGSMRESAVERLEFEANMRHGLANGEFSLALQPIVSLPGGEPIGSEALLRWRHGDRDIPPDRFIPIAEETGLIVPIGDWTIDQAARIARDAPGGRVTVNLSARQLAAPDLPARIARILAARHTSPSMIGFEVTETLLIEHFAYTAQVLSQIRDLGCRVGLDDFGTGYSSLAYLRRLPIDFVKIDGSITADIDADLQARAIRGAILAMADALHLDVVAEGIETQGQADTLVALGCRQAQGFLFGRPQPPD